MATLRTATVTATVTLSLHAYLCVGCLALDKACLATPPVAARLLRFVPDRRLLLPVGD